MSTVATIDPADVLKLPTAAKKALLDALLNDQSTHGVVHLESPDGPIHIYRPPPNARELAEEAARKATPEELAELQRRAATPEDSFSFEDALKIGEDESSSR